jgi:hypothetical protein
MCFCDLGLLGCCGLGQARGGGGEGLIGACCAVRSNSRQEGGDTAGTTVSAMGAVVNRESRKGGWTPGPGGGGWSWPHAVFCMVAVVRRGCNRL